MADNWTAITKETLYESKVAALIDACDSAALGEGQANRAAGIIAKIVKRVRRKIMSNRANRVDEDATKVPEGLVDDTVKLIIAALKNSVEMPLTEDEVREIRRIESDLNRIADGKDVIEAPDDAVEAPVESGTTIETIAEGDQGNSREDLKGL